MAGILIQVDGSSLDNPGHAGIGVRVSDSSGSTLREVSRYIGVRTNNQAEYEAMLCGLEQARDWPDRQVVVRTDSELVCRQLRGEYKVKNRQLKPLHARARAMLENLPNVTIRHAPREENREADKLARDAAASGAAK